MIPEHVFMAYEQFRRRGAENALMYFVHTPHHDKWRPWLMTSGNYERALETYAVAVWKLEIGDAGAVRIDTDGSVTTLTGSCDLARLRKELGCKWAQHVPCTHGPLAGDYEIYCDEEGMSSLVNKLASSALREQVCGGTLRGVVLLARRGFVL